MEKTSSRIQNAAKPIICLPQNYFGQALKEIRLEKGFTQIEASKKLGITQAQWSAYEVGKNRPNLDTIIAIAKALKFNPFDLLNRSLQKSKIFKGYSFDYSQQVIQKNPKIKNRKKLSKKKITLSS